MQAQSMFVTYFEFMKNCSETCVFMRAAQKIDVGFNYSWDYYESEGVWQCVTVCVTVCVCVCVCVCSIIHAWTQGTLLQQKGALISPGQHGKRNCGLCWRGKIQSEKYTHTHTHTHTLGTYTVAALLCHGLLSEKGL